MGSIVRAHRLSLAEVCHGAFKVKAGVGDGQNRGVTVRYVYSKGRVCPILSGVGGVSAANPFLLSSSGWWR
jgi:hypothetical protein